MSHRMASNTRRIEVGEGWFTALEDYLLADERFTLRHVLPSLVLETPEGKRLEFVLVSKEQNP